ncbi:J domain-containing protein [uncultured Thiodictyon sp.]|uniref:J domain-containing protein n=1 Tax=uncultured Thiodictyon sp. TaxID=1846217 RepID=UPI0025CE2938|nr:J domain-containing protein [uncultured Thiodictyon sp.]
MDANKDYYATLGLTPSADAVVVRAAYKALAQRYHPDKMGVTPDTAGLRMAELNEAYGVLSDPAKRVEYDRLREKKTQSADTAFADGDPEPSAGSPLDADWQTAVQYYPELEGLRARLAKISWKLADAFCARILRNKEFADASTIAEQLENEFLLLYFGSEPIIVKFAKTLIFTGHRDAARDLNRAIGVMGNGAEPGSIIQVIRQTHGISDPKDSWYFNKAGRRGITAQRYARQYGRSMRDVVAMIQRDDISGFKERGVFYVEIDENGDILASNAKPSANDGCLSLAFVLLAIGILVAVHYA